MKRERIVLFDGKNLDQWYSISGKDVPAPWILGEDGAMTVRHGNIVSKETYKDAHIHVEFWLPLMADREGQGRANSGVYLQGCYEVQVLDSYGIENPTCSDCGGIYSLKEPLINANLEPEQWQTYDIYFRAPRFNEAGEIVEDARVTLIFNGQCIHNNLILTSHTPGGLTDYRVAEGPLMLQDHGDPIRFRNVWFERL